MVFGFLWWSSHQPDIRETYWQINNVLKKEWLISDSRSMWASDTFLYSSACLLQSILTDADLKVGDPKVELCLQHKSWENIGTWSPRTQIIIFWLADNRANHGKVTFKVKTKSGLTKSFSIEFLWWSSNHPDISETYWQINNAGCRKSDWSLGQGQSGAWLTLSSSSFLLSAAYNVTLVIIWSTDILSQAKFVGRSCWVSWLGGLLRACSSYRE